MNKRQKEKLTEFVNEYKNLIRSKNYTKIYDILQTIDNNENNLDNQIIYCFTEMMFKIGENPFEEMEEIYYQAGKGLSITELTIPNSVNIIGDEAFMNCTKLKTVKLSDSVTEIGDMAFKDCSNLQNIIISKNFEKFGENVFDGCLNLKSIYYDGTIENWEAIKNNGAYQLGTHKHYYAAEPHYLIYCTDGDYYWETWQGYRGWKPLGWKPNFS